MTPELEALVERGRQEIASHPRGELSRGTRRKIWMALGPSEQKLDDSGQPDGAAMNAGLRRRVHLALACAERVLPVWERCFPPEDPRRMIQTTEAYLRGEQTWDTAYEVQNRFAGGLQNATDLEPETQCAAYAGHAAVAVVQTALSDEMIDEDIESDEELELGEWDAALFAAAAYAGDLPWGGHLDPHRLREFWRWYLDTALPEAYSSASP